jgi:hypothetical protein
MKSKSKPSIKKQDQPAKKQDRPAQFRPQPATPDTHVLIPVQMRRDIEENLLQVLTALRAAPTGKMHAQEKKPPAGP